MPTRLEFKTYYSLHQCSPQHRAWWSYKPSVEGAFFDVGIGRISKINVNVVTASHRAIIYLGRTLLAYTNNHKTN